MKNASGFMDEIENKDEQVYEDENKKRFLVNFDICTEISLDKEFLAALSQEQAEEIIIEKAIDKLMNNLHMLEEKLEEGVAAIDSIENIEAYLEYQNGSNKIAALTADKAETQEMK
jgi:hypothetical protein